MEQTTTEQTCTYIKNHPHIKHCLQKGLINYSALSRLIAQDLHIEKKTSKDAILIAARRYKETLHKEQINEKHILHILSHSEIEIKNKMTVFIMSKNFNFDHIDHIQKEIRKNYGTLYVLEGSDNYTLITQEKYIAIIEHHCGNAMIKKTKDLALLILKSSKDIELTPGVITYLTGLFAEHGVNIREFLSCWTDTLFIIDAKDVHKAIEFLKF